MPGIQCSMTYSRVGVQRIMLTSIFILLKKFNCYPIVKIFNKFSAIDHKTRKGVDRDIYFIHICLYFQ